MRKLTRIISCILLICLVFALTACGGGKKSLAPEAEAEDDRPARDKVYEIIEEYPIAFNGIPPKQLPDRTNLVKGLPVEKKGPADITVAYSTHTISSPYFVNMLHQLEEKCKTEGYNFIYQVSNSDTERSIQQIEAYISQGVDIILANGDVQALSPTFKKAAETGIPVVSTSAQPVSSETNVITNILAGSYKAGWHVGEYVARQIYEPGKVLKVGFVVIRFGLGDTESRGNGFVSGYLYAAREIDGNPYPSKWDAMLDGYNIWSKFSASGKLDASDVGLNLVGYGQSPGAPDAPGGQGAANDLVTANQDMDLLYVECDPMWPGVEVVLKQFNIKPGEDMLVACAADGTAYGMEAIKRGEIMAIGNNSSSMNSLGMMTIVRNLFIDGKDMNNIMPNTYTPTLAITKENLDKFYDPSKPLAAGMDYELQTVDEYNASVSDTADPF